MSETIRFWLDYFGGMEVAVVFVSVLIATQIAKPLLSRLGGGIAVRLFACSFGAVLGAFRLPPVDHGVLLGWAIGGTSAFLWFVATVYFEVGNWKDARPLIASRMRNKEGNGSATI